MTQCHFALNEINNLRRLRKPNQEEYHGAGAKLDLFKDEVTKSVWLTKELSETLAEVRGISMRFLEAAYKEEYIKADEWDAFMKTYAIAKGALKRALGVPRVEEYLSSLHKRQEESLESETTKTNAGPEEEKDRVQNSQAERRISGEKLRATLVVGLVASIIAFKLYSPSAWSQQVSLLAGTVLVYWFLYMILTAYGCSDESGRLLRAGELTFVFGGIVAASLLVWIFWSLTGAVVVSEWSYRTVWVLTMALFLAAFVRKIIGALWRRQTIKYMKEYWATWLFIMVLSIPLLLLALVL